MSLTDECQHVAPAGQSMCGCREYIEWQRGVIAVQDERIRDLQRRLATRPLAVPEPALPDPSWTAQCQHVALPGQSMCGCRIRAEQDR